jgi:hypothetical protein
VAKDLKIDIKTAQFYLQYLQDVFLIYPLYREGRSHKKVKGFSPKYYINDTGLLRLYSKTVREGHLAENAVFIELSRRAHQERREICYRITEKGEEVDFVDGDKLFDVKMGELPVDYREDVTYVVKKINKNHLAKQIKIGDLLLDKVVHQHYSTFMDQLLASGGVIKIKREKNIVARVIPEVAEINKFHDTDKFMKDLEKIWAMQPKTKKRTDYSMRVDEILYGKT